MTDSLCRKRELANSFIPYDDVPGNCALERREAVIEDCVRFAS